jgi:hypothetical protein
MKSSFCSFAPLYFYLSILQGHMFSDMLNLVFFAEGEKPAYTTIEIVLLCMSVFSFEDGENITELELNVHKQEYDTKHKCLEKGCTAVRFLLFSLRT